MKRMNRVLAIFLVLGMLMGLMVGCGGTDSSAAEVSVPEQGSVAAVETPEEAPVIPAQEEPASTPEEGSLEEEPLEEELPEISYPLSDDTITLTIMSNCFPDVSSMLNGQLINTYACKRAYEVTNVALESILFLDTTQFVMAVSSGDYPDMFGNNLVDSYTGGRAAMYYDGVIIDFADMLKEHAPDYYRYFSQDKGFSKQLTLDDGEIVSMSVYGKPINQGAMIRQDLLDELGLEVPQTYDELEEVLKAFVNSGKVQSGLNMYGLMQTDRYSGFYNGFDLSMSGAALEFQVDDGQVNMSIMTPQYREFIELLANWYQAGLIPQDFYNRNEGNTNGDLLDGLVGFSYSGVDYMDSSFFEGSNAEGSQWVPVADIRREPDQPLKYGPLMQNVTSMCQLMISTTCEYPEEALSYMNWFFTEEGSMAFNLGEEGVSYVDNGDGTYTYTDVVLHNPDGLAVRQARWLNAGIDVMPFLYVSEWQDDAAAVNEYQKTAISIWNQNKTTEGIYYGDMTSEETERYSALASDLITYASSMLPSFVLGETSLDQWETFQNTLMEMGAEELVELKQAAYERYLER